MDTARSFDMSSRYAYDNRNSSRDGWAQVDTKQDASYFGNWINPLARQWLTYAEGDVTLVTCATDDEFSDYCAKTLGWYDQRDGAPAKIDCCLDTPAYQAIRSRLGDLGFADRCH